MNNGSMGKVDYLCSREQLIMFYYKKQNYEKVIF